MNENPELSKNDHPSRGSSSESHGLAHSSKCDRRLSRAARKIVNDTIMPWIREVKNYKHDSIIPSDFVDKLYNHDEILLMQAIDTSQPAVNQKCILDPRRDVLLHHEHGYTRNRYKDGDLHTCGICKKSFTNRFYLDKHLDLRHSNDLLPPEDNSGEQEINNNQDWICPANQICNSLGGTRACRFQLDDKAFYGPRNMKIKSQKERKKSINRADKPCNKDEMYKSQLRCVEMMKSCFGRHTHDEDSGKSSRNILDKMVENICYKKLTCEYQVHRLVQSKIQNDHVLVDHNKHWENHHGITDISQCLAICGLLLYVWYYMRQKASTVYKNGQKRH